MIWSSLARPWNWQRRRPTKAERIATLEAHVLALMRVSVMLGETIEAHRELAERDREIAAREATIARLTVETAALTARNDATAAALAIANAESDATWAEIERRRAAMVALWGRTGGEPLQ